MNNLFRRTTIALFPILFLLLTLNSANLRSENKNLDSVISEYEKENSQCCVVIISAKTAELIYLYNADYSTRCFPPGSIAKIWSAAVFLEHREEFYFSPAAAIKCAGKFYPCEITESDHQIFNLPSDGAGSGNYFRCSVAAGHGTVDLSGAIANSCNVYFLTMASANPFRFLSLLEDTWQLKNGCLIRFADIAAQRPFKTAAKIITPFAAAASAIGEGGEVLVSPIKVAVLYAALFEKTPVLSPFKKPYEPLAAYSLPISEETRRLLVKALSKTLRNGTLAKLRTSGSVEILAGKTGTATHYRRKYITHGWNVIYYRMNHDRFVMVTFVFKGNGFKDAAGLSGRVLNEL